MIEPEMSDQKLIRSYKRIYLIMIYLVPFVYILMLGFLQYSDALPYTSGYYFYLYTTHLSFLILIFGILILLAILLNYKLVIPYIKKCEDSSRLLSFNMVLIANGPAGFYTLGVLIGFFGYFEYEIIDWFTVIPFTLIGLIYGIYLHKKVLPIGIQKYETLRKSKSEDF